MSSAAKSCFFFTNTFFKNRTKLIGLSPSPGSHVWVSPTTNQTHHFDTNIPGIPEIQITLGEELKINIHKILLGFNSFRIWMHLRVRSFLRSLISESLYFPVSFTNSLMTHNSFLVLVNSISFHYSIHSSSFRVVPAFPTFEILFRFNFHILYFQQHQRTPKILPISLGPHAIAVSIAVHVVVPPGHRWHPTAWRVF